MQIQYYSCQSAEQKRDFLLHLPTVEPLVLFFQSLLNSKWGDCCCSDEHEAFALLSLLFLVLKRFFTISLSAEESPWFPLMMFPSWYSRTSTEAIHTLLKGLLPRNPAWFVHIGLKCRVKGMGRKESKKYPLPSNWALSKQLDSFNRDL